MKKLTYEEMKALVKSTLGEDARVLKETLAEDGSWIVYSGIGEKFDPEDFKNTPAYEAFTTPARGYRDGLEEWYADEYGSFMLESVSVEHEFMKYNEWFEKEMIRRTRLFEKTLDRLDEENRKAYLQMVDQMLDFAVQQKIYPEAEAEKFRKSFHLGENPSNLPTHTPKNS